MLPLPGIVLFALRGSVIGLGEEGFPHLLPHAPHQILTAAILIGFALASARLLWSASRAWRVAGYLGYALVLSLGLGIGAVLAVVSQVGGVSGEPGGGPVATFLLALGSLLSGAGLLPLAALAFSDWKRSRRAVDLPRG